MMLRMIAISAVALGVLTGPTSAHALLVSFNNGAAVEADLGLRYNYGDYTIYDQFVFTERTLSLTLRWSQFDEAINYLGSTISIFDETPSETASPIQSFDVHASRFLNGLDVETDKANDVAGYNYFALIIALLDPGEYFIGIHNDVTGGRTLMANSLGTPDSVYGSYQSIVDGTGMRYEFGNADFAFRIDGLTVAVPEPGTLALLAAGLLGLGFSRNRLPTLLR